MHYEPVIGLEIHVQLKTDSKMFCGCSNRGEYEAPNTTICPVCLGQPGTLPVINKKAVEFGTLIGLALNGEIAGYSKFDRKNYFYPDLPKGYQISQFDLPVVKGGELSFEVASTEGKKRTVKVKLTRLHLEEDAAKLQHAEGGRASLVDYNRAGTPLAEIVTEPDMRTPEEAKAFLHELRLIMRYLGVSDADMEKGHLRCDANISLREMPDDPEKENWPLRLNPKTEVKNINSFRSVERALDFEIKRQTKLWLDGKPPMIGATRGWDDAKGVTVEHRTKEDAHDYRYFPEPDLPPLDLTEMAQAFRGRVPELPAARRARFMSEYFMNEADSRILVEDKDLADYAEAVMSELLAWHASGRNVAAEAVTDEEKLLLSKLVTGWLLNKLTGVMAEHKIDIRRLKITAEDFAELLIMIHKKEVTGPNAVVILTEMALTGADPSIILQEKNLGQINDSAELEQVAKNVLDANPKVVEDWKGGKLTAIQFLVGQMMKTTKGKAPPELARTLLEAELKKLP